MMAAAAAAEMIMMIETSLARSWRGCNCQSESQHRFLHPGVHGFCPRQDHVARVGVINGDSTNAVGKGTFASTGANPNEARAKSSRVQCCCLFATKVCRNRSRLSLRISDVFGGPPSLSEKSALSFARPFLI